MEAHSMVNMKTVIAHYVEELNLLFPFYLYFYLVNTIINKKLFMF